MEIKKFSIIGHSGGAPFAVACIYKISDQLNGVAIVAGIGPVEIPEVVVSLSQGQRFLKNAINMTPWIANCMMKLTSIMFKNSKLLKYGLKQMPEVDVLALQSQESHKQEGHISLLTNKGKEILQSIC